MRLRQLPGGLLGFAFPNPIRGPPWQRNPNRLPSPCPLLCLLCSAGQGQRAAQRPLPHAGGQAGLPGRHRAGGPGAANEHTARRDWPASWLAIVAAAIHPLPTCMRCQICWSALTCPSLPTHPNTNPPTHSLTLACRIWGPRAWPMPGGGWTPGSSGSRVARGRHRRRAESTTCTPLTRSRGDGEC